MQGVNADTESQSRATDADITLHDQHPALIADGWKGFWAYAIASCTLVILCGFAALTALVDTKPDSDALLGEVIVPSDAFTQPDDTIQVLAICVAGAIAFCLAAMRSGYLLGKRMGARETVSMATGIRSMLLPSLMGSMAFLSMAAYFDGIGPPEYLLIGWIIIALMFFVPAALVGMFTVWLLHIWIDRTFDPPMEA